MYAGAPRRACRRTSRGGVVVVVLGLVVLRGRRRGGSRALTAAALLAGGLCSGGARDGASSVAVRKAWLRSDWVSCPVSPLLSAKIHRTCGSGELMRAPRSSFAAAASAPLRPRPAATLPSTGASGAPAAALLRVARPPPAAAAAGGAAAAPPARSQEPAPSLAMSPAGKRRSGVEQKAEEKHGSKVGEKKRRRIRPRGGCRVRFLPPSRAPSSSICFRAARALDHEARGSAARKASSRISSARSTLNSTGGGRRGDTQRKEGAMRRVKRSRSAQRHARAGARKQRARAREQGRCG